MKRNVKVTRVYPHPPSLVWRALTEPELLAEWLMENDFALEKGRPFTFRTDPAPGFDGIVHAEVLDFVPEQLLRLAWRGGAVDTQVTFRLEEAVLYAQPATKLVLEHTGFDGLPAILTSFILEAGWRGMGERKLGPLLDRLARGEDPRPPAPPADRRRGAWWWLAQAFSPVLRRARKRRERDSR